MIDKILKPPESRYGIPGYFASPIDLYGGSQTYVPALAAAREQFPNIDFIEPMLKSWTNVTWLKEWVEIAPNLTLLAVLPRSDKTIGKGVYQEITDSGFLGIPIYIFDPDSETFRPFNKVIKLRFINRSYRNFARVYFHTSKGSVIK